MDGRNLHRAVRYHGRIGFTGHERELLIKAGGAREMVRNACQLVAGENPKGVGPDVVERCHIGNLLIGKQVQHVPGLLQRLIALRTGGIHALFGGGLGRLRILPDVIHEAGNQVVMEALIPMEDEAEQIEVRRPHWQPFELVDGIIVHQGRIVRDALIGNL